MTVKWDRKRYVNPHGYAYGEGTLIAYPTSGSGSYAYAEVRRLTDQDSGRGRSGTRSPGAQGDIASDSWSLVGPPLDGLATPPHVIKPRLHASKGSIPFASWDDLVLWARETLGVDGWDCLAGENDWTPVTGSTARPCEESVRHGDGRMSNYGTCGKPVKEDGLCGLHLAAKNRRHAAADDRRSHREQEEAAHRIAADAVAALAKFTPEGKEQPGVPASCDYDAYRGATNPGGYNGRVTIHAEDLLAILREVGWRREVMGDAA